MNSEKIINDSSFGIIKIPPYIQCIIDSKEFQRLRFINQLGFVSFVYPSATNTRFAHSIGTFDLASNLIHQLKKQLEEKEDNQVSSNDKLIITDKDVKCVEIAALCHDLGHGPFSHSWEFLCKALNENNQPYESHEERFEVCWNNILRYDNVQKELNNCSINEDEQKLIVRIVNGKPMEGDKELLFQIVNNPDSALDVDKLEYLCRDIQALGQKSTNFLVEVKRLLYFARAIKTDNGKWKVCYRNTEVQNLWEVFKLRHYTHKRAYLHKTVKAIELMFIDGCKDLCKNGSLKKEELLNSQWILTKTDGDFLMKYPDCQLFNRILSRDLYKLVFELSIGRIITQEETKKIKEEIKKSEINIEKYRIDIHNFSLGVIKKQNEKNEVINPLLDIYFFKSKDKNKAFRFIDDDKTSFDDNNLPSYVRTNLDETCLRIYSTDKESYGQFKKLETRLKEYLINNF